MFCFDCFEIKIFFNDNLWLINNKSAKRNKILKMSSFDANKVKNFVTNEMMVIKPELAELCKLKSLSPIFDKDWEKNGLLLKALTNLSTYIKAQEDLKGVSNLQIFSDKHRTPALFFTIEPSDEKEDFTILFYSHVDKIPFGEGWLPGKDPENPDIIDGLFYGRGVANGGYCLFSMVTAIKAIQNQKGNHPRVAVIIETSKESGSTDLSFYLNKYLQSTIKPDMIISLDSEILTYDSFCFATSTRGRMSFDVKITTLTKGVHSGCFGGLCPHGGLIFQKLLQQIQTIDKDGKITYPQLEVELTDEEKANAEEVAKKLGDSYYQSLPLHGSTKLIGNSTYELYLNSTLRPALTVSGMEGLPKLESSSSVIRPSFTVRLDFRTNPRQDINKGLEDIKNVLTSSPPFKASIETENNATAQGINITLSDNIKNSLSEQAKALYDENMEIIYYNSSDGLPFLNILDGFFQNIPVILTGAAHWNTSNTRGPNENLHVGYWQKVICELACFIQDYQSYK